MRSAPRVPVAYKQRLSDAFARLASVERRLLRSFARLSHIACSCSRMNDRSHKTFAAMIARRCGCALRCIVLAHTPRLRCRRDASSCTCEHMRRIVFGRATMRSHVARKCVAESNLSRFAQFRSGDQAQRRFFATCVKIIFECCFGVNDRRLDAVSRSGKLFIAQ